jgi:hypothetical protein
MMIQLINITDLSENMTHFGGMITRSIFFAGKKIQRREAKDGKERKGKGRSYSFFFFTFFSLPLSRPLSFLKSGRK